MRFFLDHCVPNRVAQGLEEERHEALRLRDHLATDAADSVVIAKAEELDAVLISLNGHFADIIRYPPKQFGGIISLQVRNHPENIGIVVAQLTSYLQGSDREGLRGRLVIVEPHRIRVR